MELSFGELEFKKMSKRTFGLGRRGSEGAHAFDLWPFTVQLASCMVLVVGPIHCTRL